MINKNASIKSWLLKRVAASPRLRGAGDLLKNSPHIPQSVRNSSKFKGILVQKDPAGVRQLTADQATHKTPFINPKGILEQTIGAGADLVSSVRNAEGVGGKLKALARNSYNYARYKPGATFTRGNNTYQVMHKRTGLGTAIMGSQFSGPGAATFSAMRNKDKPIGERAAIAAKEGVMFSPLGLPISGPTLLGREIYKGVKPLFTNQNKKIQGAI